MKQKLGVWIIINIKSHLAREDSERRNDDEDSGAHKIASVCLLRRHKCSTIKPCHFNYSNCMIKTLSTPFNYHRFTIKKTVVWSLHSLQQRKAANCPCSGCCFFIVFLLSFDDSIKTVVVVVRHEWPFAIRNVYYTAVEVTRHWLFELFRLAPSTALRLC